MSHVWHDSFVRVTWLNRMSDMAHSYVWHDSSICVTWLSHMRAMTHSYVCHDSFMCVTSLMYMCDMTHSCVKWLRVVLIRIAKRKRNWVCTSHTEFVTNLRRSQSVTNSNLWPIFFLRFSQVFLAKRVWSHFGHKGHKWSHFQMWLVQTCLCLHFLGNGSVSNEIQKNITECYFCLCFMWPLRGHINRGKR